MLLDLFEYFAKFPATAGVTKGIANKGESSMEEYATVLNFNSIKVQLELLADLREKQYRGHFNSIKVQLEQSSDALTRARYLLFQFHKGTIRT